MKTKRAPKKWVCFNKKNWGWVVLIVFYLLSPFELQANEAERRKAFANLRMTQTYREMSQRPISIAQGATWILRDAKLPGAYTLEQLVETFEANLDKKYLAKFEGQVSRIYVHALREMNKNDWSKNPVKNKKVVQNVLNASYVLDLNESERQVFVAQNIEMIASIVTDLHVSGVKNHEEAIAFLEEKFKGQNISIEAVKTSLEETIQRQTQRIKKVVSQELKGLENGKLLKAIQDGFAYTKSLEEARKNEEKRKETIAQVQASGQALGLLGQFVSLENPKLGYQITVLGTQAANIASTVLNLAGNAVNPLSGYLAITGSAFELFKAFRGAQESSPMNVVMKQLQQISKQVQQVRKEMHQRFDRIEMMLDTIYRDIMVEFASLNQEVKLIHKKLDKVLYRIDSMDEFLDKQFRELHRLGFRTSYFRCFRMNDGSVRVETKERFIECRDLFLALSVEVSSRRALKGIMTGMPDRDDWATLNSRTRNGSPENWIGILQHFAFKYFPQIGIPNASVPNPVLWARGVDYLLRINQQMKVNRADLEEALFVGDLVEEFIREIRSTPGLFQLLLSRYTEKIYSIADAVEDKRRQELRQFPQELYEDFQSVRPSLRAEQEISWVHRTDRMHTFTYSNSPKDQVHRTLQDLAAQDNHWVGEAMKETAKYFSKDLLTLKASQVSLNHQVVVLRSCGGTPSHGRVLIINPTQMRKLGLVPFRRLEFQGAGKLRGCYQSHFIQRQGSGDYFWKGLEIRVWFEPVGSSRRMLVNRHWENQHSQSSFNRAFNGACIYPTTIKHADQFWYLIRNTWHGRNYEIALQNPSTARFEWNIGAKCPTGARVLGSPEQGNIGSQNTHTLLNEGRKKLLERIRSQVNRKVLHFSADDQQIVSARFLRAYSLFALNRSIYFDQKLMEFLSPRSLPLSGKAFLNLVGSFDLSVAGRFKRQVKQHFEEGESYLLKLLEKSRSVDEGYDILDSRKKELSFFIDVD